MPEDLTALDNLLNDVDDVGDQYIDERETENRITSPLGNLINQQPMVFDREPGFVGSIFEKVFGSTDDKSGVSKDSKGDIGEPETPETQALQPAPIDPVSAFIGGGTGGFLLGGGKTLAQKVATGVLTGGIATTTEFPIGAASEAVGEKFPAAELPFTIVTSLLSGVTIERIAEKAVRKNISKLTGKIPSKRQVRKAKDSVLKSIKEDGALDETGEAVKEQIQKEAQATKGEQAKEALRVQKEEALNKIIGDESKPLVEIIPAEKGKKFLNVEPELNKHSININLSRINSSDDIKSVIDKTSKTFEGTINEARRGVQNNIQTAKLAEDLNMHPADLLARNQGVAFNAEEALAARNILASSAERLQEMALAVQSPNAGKLEMVAFRKQLTLHKAIQEQVSGGTAEAGRALQSFAIPSGSTKIKLKQIDDLITAMGDDGKLTEQMAEALLTLNDPRAVNAFVQKSYRASTTDVIMEAWINGLLSGPQTQAVNVLSNSLVAAWQIPERFLASGYSKVLFNSKDSVKFGEGMAQAWGFKQGMKEGIIGFGRAVKNESADDIVGKLELPFHRAISGDALGLSGIAGQSADYLGRAVRLPGTLLTAGDTFFKSIGYRMELNARAYRQASSEGLEGEGLARRIQQIVSSPPDDIKLAAIDAARYQTFTNELTGIAKDYQTAVGKYPPLKVLTPFVRTPTNIVKFFGERSPFAPLVKSFRDDMVAGGSRRDLAMARMSLGSSVMAVSAMLALEGNITGGGPVDPNLKSLYYDTGWQPYSIKTGNKYLSYARLEPLGTLLGVAADFAEISGEMDDQDADKLAMHLSMAIAKNITSKTFLRGISEVIQGASDPVRYGERYWKNLFGTIIPTGVSQIARIEDPVLREVSSVRDKIKSRIPGYSKDLPARRNIWGEEIVLQGGLGPDIISPIYASDMDENPVSQEMIRNKVSISKPDRQINGIELTPEEYDFYVKESGQAAKRELEKVIKSQSYLRQSDGSDGGKSIIIRNIILSLREAAKFRTMQKFPDLMIEAERRNREKVERLKPQSLQGVTVQ